jgi:hypothetical protein
MANTVIQLKYSSTPSSTPSSLANGELAINYADGKLYYKNLTGQIVSFSSAAVANVLSFATVNASGSLITATATNSILTISNGDNIEIAGDIINDIITISANLKPAFDRANSKTYTFFQNTKPSTSNSHDLWVNSDTGVVYENFGTTSTPIWAEFGPSTAVANLTPGVVSAANLVFNDGTYQTTAGATRTNAAAAFSHSNITYTSVNSAFGVINAAFGVANNAYTSTNGTAAFAFANGVATNTTAAFGLTNTTYAAVNSAFGVINSSFGKANTALQNTSGTFAGDLTITGNTIHNKKMIVNYTPSAVVNAAIEILAANTQGGIGYADFFKFVNISGGSTNPNKFIRLDSVGSLQVIDSSYGNNIFMLTNDGNITTKGTIVPGAYSAGQVIKDVILSNSEVTVVSTTIAPSGTSTNFITYNYTPVSASSYLIVHYHLSKYQPQGTTDDSWYSQLLVDAAEIAYGWQMVNDNGSGTSGRSGVLFPLTGRYTNSSTSAKQIQVAARRDSADDSILIDNTATSMWLRITEVAR